jgi:NADH dehydrogenase [ubiquinone] 1 alpha subcomplex assembly factor 7
MSLRDRLRAEIQACGPLSVAQYMTACLHDPMDGYYAARPALGEAGDFITAPLVSQMFGELLGLWAVETWRGMGRPGRLLLVEVGPGDGTLIDDALRAARLDPAFIAAAELWLVETSAPLAALQRRRLAEAPLAPRWAASLAEPPDDAPILLIANELLDCLPARQYVRTASGWVERVVGLDAAGALAFGLAPCAAPCERDAPVDAVLEISAAQAAFAAELAARLARQGGAALLIDYGPDRPAFGDTLQALRRHEKVDPLAAPGEADLTVHADFPNLLAAARAGGVATALAPQGLFLQRLGVETRAAALTRARPRQAGVIARQLARLIDPDQMGALFKAACLYAPAQPVPPGFEEAA